MNHEFSGKGVMVLDNQKEYDIEFVFAQRDNGRLLFCAELEDITAMPNIGHFINNISGTLDDGRLIELDGKVSLTSSLVSMTEDGPLCKLIGSPTGWVIGKVGFSGKASMHFEIANFLFTGDSMNIKVNGDNLVVTPVENYEEVIAILRAQKGIQVTSTVAIKIDNQTDLDKKIEYVEIISDLMSLARSTLINWLSFNIEVEGEGVVYSRFRNSIIKNYNPITLIPNNEIEGTKRFLETGYSRYKEFDNVFQFREVTRRYADTRGDSFLETRGLTIAVQVEILASRFAKYKNLVLFMGEEEFKKKSKMLMSEVQKVIKKIHPTLKNNFVEGMASKIRGFNYRGLAGKIKKLNKWLNAGISDSEITTFVESRNFLAHYGNFPDDKDKKLVFFQMAHFLDRLILRLFDYRGTYFNMEDQIISQI